MVTYVFSVLNFIIIGRPLNSFLKYSPQAKKWIFPSDGRMAFPTDEKNELEPVQKRHKFEEHLSLPILIDILDGPVSDMSFRRARLTLVSTQVKFKPRKDRS